MATITIPARFNGPRDSGHGGYSSGVVAGLLATPARVELRSPPPLDRPLRVSEVDDGVEVWHGDTLVARARASDPPDLTPPVAVDVAAARAAVDRFAGFVSHSFPACFGCGPERAAGDGLRLFPGRVEGVAEEVVATPWTPEPALAGDDGAVAPVYVWAALDCPSGYAVFDGRTGVLAGFQVRQDTAVPVGEELVVLGWPRGEDGRKLFSASAVQDARGRVLAVAEALWIELPAS